MENYYWLNDDARLFLERGYLKENQSPEERIKEICDNAERILGIEGFSAKMEGYLARGFYSLATPVWVNFGNERGLPVSCFGSHISDKMYPFQIIRSWHDVQIRRRNVCIFW